MNFARCPRRKPPQRCGRHCGNCPLWPGKKNGRSIRPDLAANLYREHSTHQHKAAQAADGSGAPALVVAVSTLTLSRKLALIGVSDFGEAQVHRPRRGEDERKAEQGERLGRRQVVDLRHEIGVSRTDFRRHRLNRAALAAGEIELEEVRTGAREMSLETIVAGLAVEPSRSTYRPLPGREDRE